MLRKLLAFFMLLITLAALSGCIIHDPGYYPGHRGYYSAPYYPYYYGPYLYSPFWFGGYYFFDDFDQGHHFYKHRALTGMVAAAAGTGDGYGPLGAERFLRRMRSV